MKKNISQEHEKINELIEFIDTHKEKINVIVFGTGSFMNQNIRAAIEDEFFNIYSKTYNYYENVFSGHIERFVIPDFEEIKRNYRSDAIPAWTEVCLYASYGVRDDEAYVDIRQVTLHDLFVVNDIINDNQEFLNLKDKEIISHT